MNERAARAVSECRRIAGMSEEAGRTTRRFLTPPVRDVHALLGSRMEALGMAVSVDAVGNLRGVWQPPGARERRVILGSHIDTVPDAGAFDGVLGVAIALELVELAQQFERPLPIEVIAFSEEEGVRFGVPFIGSRAVAGRFDPALLALKDADGTTLEEAIRVFGLDPGRVAEAELGADALAYFETHIEQGPVLEAEGLQVAAVTSIAGQSRFSLRFVGDAGHAGTTPMPLRRDALAGAAEFIIAVETRAKKTEGLVATVGRLQLEPNAGNVVPGMVRITCDVRHADDAIRRNAAEALLAEGQSIAGRRRLQLECARQMDQPAVPMDERLTAYLAETIQAAGLPLRLLPSGAGHDAMVMGARVPAAMLFVRSPGGVSHHPDEQVLDEDVTAALKVGREFLRRLAAEVSDRNS